MKKAGLLGLAVLVLIAIAATGVFPVAAQEEATVKITVIETTKFTNLTSYMYDDTNKKLADVNTSYAEVLDYELSDKDSSDPYMPAVLVDLAAPTVDLNTNETVEYAVILSGVYGDGLLIAVADINSTDNTVLNMSYYKISPVSGDVAIVRTSYDIVIEGEGYKLSIPLSGFTEPKVMIMTDSYVSVSSIQRVELRALRNPPSGFTLIRSGSGETVFTISASGALSIWFDEEHDSGDLDLFVYDINDPDYSTASLSQSWSWHMSHATTWLWSDTHPYTRTIDAHGTVKFIVKRFSGNAAGVSWRVACRLSSGQPSTTTPTQPSTTEPAGQSTQSAAPIGLLGSVQSALSGTTAVYIVIGLLFLLVLAVLLRR